MVSKGINTIWINETPPNAKQSDGKFITCQPCIAEIQMVQTNQPGKQQQRFKASVNPNGRKINTSKLEIK